MKEQEQGDQQQQQQQQQTLLMGGNPTSTQGAPFATPQLGNQPQNDSTSQNTILTPFGAQPLNNNPSPSGMPQQSRASNNNVVIPQPTAPVGIPQPPAGNSGLMLVHTVGVPPFGQKQIQIK